MLTGWRSYPAGRVKIELLSKQPRLYRRRGASREASVPFPPGQPRKKPVMEAGTTPKSNPLTLSGFNQQVLLRHFKTAVVLRSPKGRILHFYGDTSKYLGRPTGEADLNILPWPRDGWPPGYASP